jgi:hypothetical protein
MTIDIEVGRVALELGKELDHFGRLPDESPEALGRLDLNVVRRLWNKAKPLFAAVKLAQARQVHFDNRGFADERAVARIEIGNANAPWSRLHFRMHVAHRGIIENQRAALGAPDVQTIHADRNACGLPYDLDAPPRRERTWVSRGTVGNASAASTSAAMST